MESIALFGGGGFIGSHLVRELLNEEYKLIVVDLSSEKIRDVLPHPKIEYLELDIRNDENDAKFKQIVDDSDLVVDLVAYANPVQYVDKPVDVVELNYHDNMKIVEDCAELDTRLIQFSTCEVYGKMGGRSDGNPVFEEDESDLIMGPIHNQRWIYATAKQLLERMVHAYGIEKGLDWSIIRPFNFVGPEMDYIITSPDEGTPRVFASFMSALMYDHTMYLVNGGTNRRSFTYIDDAVRAIKHVVENEGKQFSGEIINVGSPENEVTVEQFAHLMRDIYQDISTDGSLPEVEEISGEAFYGDGYADCERRVPDISKLERAGWEPEYDLRESLEEAMRYYIEKHEEKQIAK
ncbi:bifunctional UDP-4-keto-pentose/UDP-xylose synthase [Halobacteriaceae archaeon SHR40]|uniref:bifunctional UDP-4-keto-pentose/UDP-xylose synthase n=1 Tax=Halovenus amylolytica TaxID=2500550 RepID=UPI000FE3416D